MYILRIGFIPVVMNELSCQRESFKNSMELPSLSI